MYKVPTTALALQNVTYYLYYYLICSVLQDTNACWNSHTKGKISPGILVNLNV